MSVQICHASIDENGKAKNGKSGDQTSKEVCIRNWYSKDWNVLLRPKSTALAENSVRIAKAIAENPNVGYDQNQRNTLWHQCLKHKISEIEPCETDCSAFMTTCAILGGANIEYGKNAPTTRTMRNIFSKGGYEVITDKRYLSSDEYLKSGDILVCEGHHTVMAISDGNKANESPKDNNASNTQDTIIIPSATLKKGSKGTNVIHLQNALNILAEQNVKVDGVFGSGTENAVMNVQRLMLGVNSVDGIYGKDTRLALKEIANDKSISFK